MKIVSISLSNILSFPFAQNIDDAVKVSFDSRLNILIGGNGSGKSTVLEALNFIFKRVLFKPYEYSNQRYLDTSAGIRQQAFSFNPEMAKFRNTFRLNPNWTTENQAQVIRLSIELDELDKDNIDKIIAKHTIISQLMTSFSPHSLPAFSTIIGNEKIDIDVALSFSNDSFSASVNHERPDIQFYLTEYELIKELIDLHNSTSLEKDMIETLSETFTMLSAFRNYYSFSGGTSLVSDVRDQMRSINHNNKNQGINSQTGGEPSIFSIIKLKLASTHFDLIQGKASSTEAEAAANASDVLVKINDRLKMINLKCSVKLVDVKNWSYIFEFIDIKRKKPLGDISNLSAGQRSIIHLVFEAYGRDDMKGGVVVIDEPEIHLHYQFQYEYLRIIETVIKDLGTQYILVTHSDGFISSETATYIKRFSLDENRHSVVHSPNINTPQKKMIEILDNKQSARALFSNKVVLVEGQDDRYFFRTLFDQLHPELKQEVSVYDANSRDSIASWREFFEQYGLKVYEIKDLDAACVDIYNEPNTKLVDPSIINQYRTAHASIDTDIDALYQDRKYILKKGPLEAYMGFPTKGIDNVMLFCETFSDFLDEDNDLTQELVSIAKEISQ